MLESLLRPLVFRRLARFERRHGYDLSYARELFELSPQAFFRFAKFFGLAGFAQDLSPAMFFAAKFAATRAQDCGPCSQLMLGMAQQAGVPDQALQALIDADTAAMPADMRLAWGYAQAALAQGAELADWRERVLQAHGPRALASLALAIVVARSFPMLKQALGHGQACAALAVPGLAAARTVRHSAAALPPIQGVSE